MKRKINNQSKKIMFRLKFYAAMFAVIIGLLTTFTQTARAESWSWESILSVFSSANAVVDCTPDPVVVNGFDSGAGSLRQAVIDACPGSTITFSDSMREVSLSTDQILINKNLTIAGPGAGMLTVRNGAGPGVNFRIFEVASGVTAAISGLTISDGKLTGGNGGGGILNIGNLTLSNSIVNGNLTQFRSGGIHNAGNLTVTNSTITENFAAEEGGGIYSHRGTVIITDSIVSLNTGGKGGGIFITTGTLELTNSSLIRNYATNSTNNASGGGLFIFISDLGIPGSATLTNSTVSGNRVDLCTRQDPLSCSPGFSTGIYNNGSLKLMNSTVADNIVGTYDARNSIIAGNTDGTLISQGYNLIKNNAGTTITGDTTGNIVGTNTAPIDARLSSLGFYGGPTQTHALLTGSPAINTGNTATSPVTDQRGAPRVGAADIGAFELNNSANGGTFVAQLPDGFTNTPYSFMLGGNTYSLTGGALPTGVSLSTSGTVSGTTDQTGVFNFSVTATDGTNSFVTDYSVRFLYRPPVGCISNPIVLYGLDSGAGTLRQAVIDACPGSTITFSATMPPTVSLTTGEITIDKDLTIAGPGANVLTIIPKTGSFVTAFGVGSVTAAISGLTISTGHIGIVNDGNLTVTGSTVSKNYRGGGIVNHGNLTVVNSMISENRIDVSSRGGGGIYSSRGLVTITDSTVSPQFCVQRRRRYLLKQQYDADHDQFNYQREWSRRNK